MVKKRIGIEREIRSRIVTGKYLIGGQLPTRTTLEEEFGVSSNTVQVALSRLIEDDFIESRGREGTFVTMTPPHLNRIALLFPNDLETCISHNQYYRSLHSAIDAVSEKCKVNFKIVDRFAQLSNRDGIQQLVDEVTEHRLGGIIFATAPFALSGTPIYDLPGIARVGVMSRPWHNMPAVWHDDEEFLIKSATSLAERGANKPAFLVPDSTTAMQVLTKIGKKLSLTIEPRFIQQVNLSGHDGMANLLELLFGHSDRPDSLVIGDDNLLDKVASELKMMGLSDLPLVCQANFPLMKTGALPAVHIGYESDRILEICVENIQQQLRGETPEPLTTLPALYENEVRR